MGKDNERSTYETVDTGVDDGDLDLHGQGLVLALLEELSETGATREQETSGGIKIGTKLSEGSDFTVLRKVKLERTSELLHDLAVNQQHESLLVTSWSMNAGRDRRTSGRRSRHERRKDRR